MNPCKVCAHQDEHLISPRLAAGDSLRQLAREFGLKKDSLARHKKHLARAFAARAAAIESAIPRCFRVATPKIIVPIEDSEPVQIGPDSFSTMVADAQSTPRENQRTPGIALHPFSYRNQRLEQLERRKRERFARLLKNKLS